MRNEQTLAVGTLGIAIAAALAVFAFFSAGPTPTAHAETRGIQNLQCVVAPPITSLPTPPETLTCTFDFHGTPHTFVADFQLSLTAPHLHVTSCTLDTKPVHIGPCP